MAEQPPVTHFIFLLPAGLPYTRPPTHAKSRDRHGRDQEVRQAPRREKARDCQASVIQEESRPEVRREARGEEVRCTEDGRVEAAGEERPEGCSRRAR